MVMHPVFPAIPIKYEGLFADDSHLDAQQLGKSLQGLARVSNGALHFYFEGDSKADPRLHRTRVYVSPPAEGSFLFEIIAIAVGGGLPLYFPLLCDMAEQYVPKLLSAVINWKVGRKMDAEKAIEGMIEIANRSTDFAEKVHDGHMKDKEWMQEHIAELSRKTAPAMRDLPEPVGRSCRQMLIGNQAVSEPVVIDEPTAKALQSRDELVVADSREFTGHILGVDTVTGACKLEVEGGTFRGKITDPSLAMPENAYTHALDTQRVIVVQAKPVLKDGEINQLYISDAKIRK